MNFVPKEIGEKVSPEIIDKYLNIPSIGIGEIKEVYAEVIRLDSKFTVNGNPYISFKFKDVNGRVISASMFDSTFESDVIEMISRLKKVYCLVKYEAVCLKSTVHLQVKEIKILDNDEVTSELSYAFTPEFKDTQKYLEKIRNTNFGEYQNIFEQLIKSNILKTIEKMSFDEFGNAKIGAMSRVISNVLERVESSELSTKYLTKIVALYSIVFYCITKPVCSLGINNGTVNALRKLGAQLDVFRTGIPGELTEKFCEEVERVICNFYNVETMNSTTSEAIRLIIKNEKELSDLVSLSYSVPKGYMINYKGDRLVNK